VIDGRRRAVGFAVDDNASLQPSYDPPRAKLLLAARKSDLKAEPVEGIAIDRTIPCG